MPLGIRNYEGLVMQIISHAGTARSLMRTVLQESRNPGFNRAALEMRLREADAELGEAHKAQTELIQLEARGEGLEVAIILVHAQDILMTALSERDLVAEIIDLRLSLAAAVENGPEQGRGAP